MKVIFLSLFALSLLLFVKLDVHACSCEWFFSEKATLQQLVTSAHDYSKVVFSGKVLEIINNPENDFAIVKFKVKNVWKGEIYEEISITTRNYDGGCGYDFEMGETYLVYAYSYRIKNTGVSSLRTDMCQRNGKLRGAKEDLKILGKGKKPLKGRL